MNRIPTSSPPMFDVNSAAVVMAKLAAGVVGPTMKHYEPLLIILGQYLVVIMVLHG